MYEVEVIIVLTVVFLIIFVNEAQIVYGQDLVLLKDLVCCCKNCCVDCCQGERDMTDGITVV